MALMICPDCTKNVSDLAAICPHCGRPMQATAAERIQLQRTPKEIKKKMMMGGLIFWTSLFVFMAIAFISVVYDKKIMLHYALLLPAGVGFGVWVSARFARWWHHD